MDEWTPRHSKNGGGCSFNALPFWRHPVILWENCRINDVHNDAMMSVDGTYISVPQFKPFWKGWYSHKLNGPGARWEVGLSIQSRHIVWIHGPFPCGHWPDLNISRHSMISCLDDDEKAEADDGYMGEPTKTLIPKDNTYTPADAELRQRVRNRHEIINRRLKEWKCLGLSLKPSHSLEKNSMMFCAVAVICQIPIESGETTLFDVDYDDQQFSSINHNHT